MDNRAALSAFSSQEGKARLVGLLFRKLLALEHADRFCRERLGG